MQEVQNKENKKVGLREAKEVIPDSTRYMLTKHIAFSPHGSSLRRQSCSGILKLRTYADTDY
jgi:hypothetical protein